MTVVPATIFQGHFGVPSAALSAARRWMGVVPDAGRAMVVGALLWLATGMALFLSASVSPVLSNEAPPGPALDDFGVFFSAARLIADGRGDELYDRDAIHEQEARVYERPREQVPLLPYFNPPPFAAALVPLTGLSVGTAAALYLAVSLLLLAAGVLLLLRGSSAASTGTWLALATLFAFQSVYDTIFHGQLSFLLLFLFAASFTAFASGRERLAGALLGLLLIKPNYALVALLPLLWKRRREALIGFGAVATVWAAVSLAVSGPAILWNYPQFLREAAGWDDTNGITIVAMFGWNALVRLHVGPGRMDAVNLWSGLLAVATVALLLWAWKGPWAADRRTLAPRYSALALAAMLVNPHVYRQDVMLALVPAFLLLGCVRGVARAALGAFFFGGWLLFMYHFVLMRELGINVTVPLMGVAFVVACVFAARSSLKPPEEPEGRSRDDFEAPPLETSGP